MHRTRLVRSLTHRNGLRLALHADVAGLTKGPAEKPALRRWMSSPSLRGGGESGAFTRTVRSGAGWDFLPTPNLRPRKAQTRKKGSVPRGRIVHPGAAEHRRDDA